MKHEHTIIIASVALLASIGGTAFAMTDRTVMELPEQEVAITGDALKTASAAALAHTGNGRVTETEVGDEESYYEVEVTLDNGKQVDVQLNEAFKVVGQKIDNETETAG